MADLAKLVVRIEADNAKLRSELVKTTSKIQKFEKRTVRSVGVVTKSLAGLAGGFAIGSAIKSGIGQIAGFEQSLSNVQAVTGATAGQLQSMSDAARDLGATTAFSAQEAAEGMEFLGRAGFDTEQIISAMPGLLDLAAAGAVDLGQAADIASNVLSGFNLAASESNRVADVLAATAASSNTNVEQLGEAMSFVAPVSAALGISIEDTAAAIGILGNAGIQASRAGTGLRGILATLANASPKAQTAIEGLGLTVQELDPATNSLESILRKLQSAGLDAGTALEIFGKVSAPSIVALTSQVGGLSELTDKLGEAEGTARRMAEIQLDNLTGDVKQLSSAFSELVLQIGEESGVSGALRKATQAATEFIRGLDNAIDTGAPSLDQLQKQLAETGNLGADGGGGRGGRQARAKRAELKRQIEEQIAALPGPDAVRSRLELVEKEIEASQARIQDISGKLGAGGDEAGGSNVSDLGQFRLNKELEKQIALNDQLEDQRGLLVTQLGEAEASSKAVGDLISKTVEPATQLGEVLDQNNAKLEQGVSALTKQGEKFAALVQGARDSVNGQTDNPLIAGTTNQVLRDLDSAASLSADGSTDESIAKATKALDLIKQLSEQGKITDQFANQLINRAESIGVEATGGPDVQAKLDEEAARANAISLREIVQNEFTVNPVQAAITWSAPTPNGAPVPGLAPGATRADGTPILIDLNGRKAELNGSGEGVEDLRNAVAREKAATGSR